MSITLNTYASGDTNYVSKLDADMVAIAAAITALQTSTSGGSGSSSSYLPALLGTTAVRIGSSSYTQTNSGSTLAISAGSVWKPSVASVITISTPTNLSFVGKGSGTYYIIPDAAGAPTISTTSSVDSIYTVVWDGANFLSVTSTASVMLSATDEQALLVSSHFGTTFSSLQARLNAIEANL